MHIEDMQQTCVCMWQADMTIASCWQASEGILSWLSLFRTMSVQALFRLQQVQTYAVVLDDNQPSINNITAWCAA